MDFINHKRMLEWITPLTLLWLAACASTISPEVLKDVDQSIRFEALLKNLNAFQGKTVLFGGDIIKTENSPDKTLIVVLQRSLNSDKKPSGGDRSAGRFIVSVPGFLDPAIFQPGRQITVVGVVAGKEVRALDDIEYSYPVIDKRHLYLWQRKSAIDTGPRVYFGFGAGIGW
jgi:outer membrane lipoprotein